MVSSFKSSRKEFGRHLHQGPFLVNPRRLEISIVPPLKTRSGEPDYVDVEELECLEKDESAII